MRSRPTRRTVLAFSGIALASAIAGCAGDSSSSTTDEPADTTADPTTAPQSTTPPAESTTGPSTRTTQSTQTTDPRPTETTPEPSPTTSSEPATTMAERTTYPGGDDRLTVKGVEAPGSTSGQLMINPPNTVSLVEFFATWCGPCKDQMSTLRKIRSEFSRDRVSFISVTQEDKPDAVQDFWKKYDGTWRVGIDASAKLTQKFGIRGFPTALVLLPDGTETARHVGSGSHGLASDIRDALEKADL